MKKYTFGNLGMSLCFAVASNLYAEEVLEVPAVEMITDVPAPASANRVIGPTNEFGGSPSFPGSRRNMAFGEAPDEYQVESGDTLYDICDQLIDDPDYWPKLWSLNPYIKNPHFIYPGMRIKFFPGDEQSPPSIQIVQQDEVLPVEMGGVIPKEVVKPKRDISTLLVESVAVDEKPIVSSNEISVPESISGDFEFDGPRLSFDSTEVVLPFVVSSEEKKKLGTILGGDEGQLVIDMPNDIIVRGENLPSNTVYSIVRYSSKVYSPKSGDFLGYRYEFIGNAKVIGPASEDDDDLFRLKPTYIRIPPTRDDVLVSFVSTKRQLKYGLQGRSNSAIEASIAGLDEPTKVIAGQGDMVLLDGKFNTDEIVSIYSDMRKDGNTAAKVEKFKTVREVGKVRIIDNFSSNGVEASIGFIISSKVDLRIGDRTSSKL